MTAPLDRNAPLMPVTIATVGAKNEDELLKNAAVTFNVRVGANICASDDLNVVVTASPNVGAKIEGEFDKNAAVIATATDGVYIVGTFDRNAPVTLRVRLGA